VWSIDADKEHLPSWYTDEAHEYEDAARADHLIPQLAAWKATGKYPGSLDLRSVTTLPKSCKFEVGGSLDLPSVTTIPTGCTFNVKGGLALISVTTMPKGCTFDVGGNLDLSSVTTIPKGCTFNVGGWLALSSVTTIPKGCTFNVGGWLDLSSVTKKPNMKQIKVKGKLILAPVIPKGFERCPVGYILKEKQDQCIRRGNDTWEPVHGLAARKVEACSQVAHYFCVRPITKKAKKAGKK
jgi:hypothetical protein